MNEPKLNFDGSYALNIQPKAGIIGVFSRLNYKPWYAIAEFVDNSTQSFYSHEKELAAEGIGSVRINIDYDSERNILTIADDAFGMNLEEFSRAVQMDIEPENKMGRNEFGMGLKTAASWFGSRWSVESCRLGETETFFTEVNIPLLRKDGQNSVKIIKKSCGKGAHGTTIKIYDITKKISAPRTKSKIIEILESMYRRDLNSMKVNLSFNGTPLHFDEYKCLVFKNKEWKKDVDFSFDYENVSYHVSGFVGILAEGGFGKAGFALFRRGRVVIGGLDMNYKPDRIFIQPQSTIAHKLFGEFDLDDFPVNQAKDGFVWDNGLEDEFVEKLKQNIQEYINIAKLTKKERVKEEEFTKQTSENIQKEVSNFVQHISEQNYEGSNKEFLPAGTSSSEKDLDLFNEYLEKTNNEPESLPDFERTYDIKINAVVTKTFSVKWSIASDDYWIHVDDYTDEKKVDVIININHSFFKPYSNNPEFKVVLEKFVVAFVVAEQTAKVTADGNGYIKSSLIRNNMNKFLSQIKGG